MLNRSFYIELGTFGDFRSWFMAYERPNAQFQEMKEQWFGGRSASEFLGRPGQLDIEILEQLVHAQTELLQTVLHHLL